MNFRSRKTAIIHDVLLEYGGAERVLEMLLRVFPNSDLYTFYYNKENDNIARFNRYKPRTSIFQHISYLFLLNNYFSVTKLFSWIYFYFLDLKKYDLIISSCHSYNSKMVKKSQKALHICYIHSPPRYLYEEQNEMVILKQFPLNILLLPILKVLTYIDYRAAQHPNIIITSSKEMQSRIKRYYNRKSHIIYPPLSPRLRDQRSKQRKMNSNDQKYYIFHSRLVRQKGPELAITTCKRYELPLKVVGNGYLLNHLKSIAGPTIKFLGFVKDKKLPLLYSKAKALLFCARDEDFGIVPIEAMSYGVPVVAFRSGGVVETVIENKTGVFFNEYSPEALYRALKQLETIGIKADDCVNRAKQFSASEFNKRLLRIIKENHHETRRL